MNKQQHSINSNGVERKRPKVEDSSSGKRVKVDGMEDDNGNQIEEATTTQEDTISAEEFFVGVLSKIPRGSKKKTLNSFIRTLLQLKDTVKDEDDQEDDLPIKHILETAMINPIILPEPAPLPEASPLAITRSPNPMVTTFAPATMASGSNVVVTYSPVVRTSIRSSPAKMPALEACPPLTAAAMRSQAALTVPQVQTLPTPVNPQDIIRAQHQIRQEKVKMVPPQTMSPMDASIQQKERAFHQAALQQQMQAPSMAGADSDAVLVTNLKNKILMSIQSNHDGKATDEDINRYLRQNFFMILDNNQYIYVPNPWLHRPQYIKQFMSQPPAQPQQPPPMMLPPRLPQINQLQSVPQIQNLQGNLLHPHMVASLGGTVSPAGGLQNWPTSQNILLNTLQPNIITTAQGVPILNSPKAVQFDPFRKNDWSVKTIPLPTCPHVDCNCFANNSMVNVHLRH